jgi:Kef-type K+ transport system membrane component KefB/predicted transcriptional regulator
MHDAHIPVLLVIGLAIFLGSIGARIFQWLRIPQVVGYIIIGILIGKSGFGLIDETVIGALQPLNFFALGVIGFMIGGELHRQVFQRHGRQFMKLLISEGITAFLLVGFLTWLGALLLTGQPRAALALGLLLGAIASATAPAATVDVLWEYKTRGILTSTVLALVALDDGLALFLFGFAASIAGALMGTGSDSLLSSFLRPAYELVGAAALGACTGFALNWLLRRMHAPDKALTLIIGSLALLLGGALMLEMDVILSAMALGMTLINLAPHRSRETFDIVEKFSPPIYALFFVFVGARLTVNHMPAWMWILAVAYVIGRTGGKMLGANLGARWAGSPLKVRKYLGMCLFSQAGVAIGLSILAGMRFADVPLGNISLGTTIVLIVTATTFLVQIIGPPCVKYAVRKGGEVGLNVAEEDLVRTFKAADVMQPQAPAVHRETTVTKILQTISQAETMSCAVVDQNNHVQGVILLEDLRACLADPEVGGWLVAADIMKPAPDSIPRDTALKEALRLMTETGLDTLPVVASASDRRYAGLLERRTVNEIIRNEVIARRQRAENSGLNAG